MLELSKWLLEKIQNYFSDQENRSKVFNYIKSFYLYISSRKLIKNFIFYGLFVFLLFTSVLQLNIDFKYNLISGITYISNIVIESSMDLKRSLILDIHKKAIIEDNTNKVFMSDNFKIEKINHDGHSNFNAVRFQDTVYYNYNNYRLIGEYSWNKVAIDTDKCKNLLLLFKEEKTSCIIQTINNSNTTEWINGCFMIDVMIKEAMKYKKINNNTAILICGIKYQNFYYYVYMYIGENYSKMQEFQRNIFLNKIMPVFNVKKTIN